MRGNTVESKLWRKDSDTDNTSDYWEPVDTRGYCDEGEGIEGIEPLLSFAIEQIIKEVQVGTVVLKEGQTIEVQIQIGVSI